MAFPSDLEIEVAFNNDIDETTYGQSGWTSILPFVSSFDGDLRGREYELDRAEAGTLSVVLDNSDSRFLPGSVQSPYFPYVKSDRRFRIRGKNMVHPNVARGGSRDRNLSGFQEYGDGIGVNYTGNVYPFDSVRVITASAEPFVANGEGKDKANDGQVRTKWVTNTSTGWLQYKYAIGVRMSTYTVTSANDVPTRDPKNWTLCGSNDGTTFTPIHTVTGEVFTDRYETHTYTISSPNYYQYYKLNITLNNTDSLLQLAEWDLQYDSVDDVLLPDGDLSHYLEITIPASRPNNWYKTFGWFVPLEYGVRISHSGYAWKINGTEPTGLTTKFEIHYLDKDWNLIPTTQDINWAWNTPTPTAPSQGGFAHTPPSDAKYALMHFAVFIGTTTNSTDLIYGVTGIQSELPVNLAPDISGFRDIYNWQVEGDGDGDYYSVGAAPATSYLEVKWGANDTNLYMTIPHLIPGEAYTATMEAKILNSQPSVQFTGNEGETGPIISTGTFTKYTCSFIAQQPEQELRWVLQGTPTAGVIGLQVRLLNVQLGDNLTLSLPVNAIEAPFTTWVRPKDIFEGWIESWPAVAGNTEMTVTVVDRMKRLGQVDLANTLRESLYVDEPVLLMPLSDSMIDTPGRFSQLGSWALEGMSYVDIAKSRGDLGIASYTTSTDDGPTGEASWKGTPVGTGFNKGYFFAIPYSKDYTAPPPVVSTPKPTPKPPPASTPRTKSTYTKKWYATWSRSYEGDNSTRFDDTPYMYQGSYDGSSPGNQKSLAGFDYKNIAATLKGAEIVECYITVKNNHARWNKGLYAQIGTHNYTSKPSTWNGSNVIERRYGKKWVSEGGTLTINTGVVLGKELLSGATRGISIGPEATDDHDNYGYFYGATHSARPYITIKYRK